MLTVNRQTIDTLVTAGDLIDRMRDAMIAYSLGECETPMPMHLDIAQQRAEVHIKSAYRQGGPYFVLKVASTFPNNADRGISTGNGMMMLMSASTGEPVALLADEGHLTDLRTAAVTAIVTRELGRDDRCLGILGTGIQARLQAEMHAAVLPLERIVLWGRNRDRTEACAAEISRFAKTITAASPIEVAAQARLIICCTASREPMLKSADLRPGTHIAAVGSDSPGKQELAADAVRSASLLLVDSIRQCAVFGELQHAPEQRERAIEIGTFCLRKTRVAGGFSVCDFTGVGVQDLYIAQYCYEKLTS